MFGRAVRATAIIFLCSVAWGGFSKSGVIFAETTDQRVQVKMTAEFLQAGRENLAFDLIDMRSGGAISDKDLIVETEKLLHLFMFDSALVEFRHLHPKFDGSKWVVETDLSTDGKYWVWAQGRLAADNSDFEASSNIRIEGGNPENIGAELKEGRTGVVLGSKVTLSSEAFRSGKVAMPILTFSRTDGTPPQLSDYLGAKAHVVIVPSAGDSLVHVHPMDSRVNQLMIHVVFPKPDSYRIWVQFIDAGILKVVPLAVEVKN